MKKPEEFDSLIKKSHKKDKKIWSRYQRHKAKQNPEKASNKIERKGYEA